MLTSAELEVLQAVADGASYSRIATERGTTEQVIKNTMCRLLRELGCDNRTHAAVTAVRRGLID